MALALGDLPISVRAVKANIGFTEAFSVAVAKMGGI
jgi:hypothetical protein